MKHKVAVAELEKKLEKEHEGRATAALFNLVVHVQDVEHAHDALETIQQVLRRFPCRVIFLTEDPDAKFDYFNTEVTAETMGSVACDQIFLSFAGKERQKVPFIVLPHLLPDLPIYLLWTGDPAPDDVIFPTLEQHTSRIILDPDTLHRLPEYSRFVLMLLRSSFSSVVDIHWAAISGWRRVLAEILTDEVKQMVITSNERTSGLNEDPRIKAAYLQGWLASCLGWEPTSLIVKLVPTQSDQPLGSISKIVIDTDSDRHIELVQEGKHVKVSCTSPEKCDLPYTLPLSSQLKEDALAREIFQKESSGHYESMMEYLAKLQWS